MTEPSGTSSRRDSRYSHTHQHQHHKHRTSQDVSNAHVPRHLQGQQQQQQRSHSQTQHAAPSPRPPNGLAFPPPAHFRSHYSVSNHSNKSPSPELGSPISDDASQVRGSTQHRRGSSLDSRGREGYDLRHQRTHEARRSTQHTISEAGWHDGRYSEHRVSLPRSHEQLRGPSPTSVGLVREYSEEDLDDADDEEIIGHQLLRAMLFLSAPVPILSLMLCIYALPVTLIATLLSPLRIFICSMDSLSVRAQRYLLPALNMQRRCMLLHPLRFLLRPLPGKDGVVTNISDTSALLPCNTGSLLCLLLVSPVLSAMLGFAAWITSAAWLVSGMLNHESIADVSKGERKMARNLFNIWLNWLDWPLKDGVDFNDWDEEQKKTTRMPEVLEIKAPSV